MHQNALNNQFVVTSNFFVDSHDLFNPLCNGQNHQQSILPSDRPKQIDRSESGESNLVSPLGISPSSSLTLTMSDQDLPSLASDMMAREMVDFSSFDRSDSLSPCPIANIGSSLLPSLIEEFEVFNSYFSVLNEWINCSSCEEKRAEAGVVIRNFLMDLMFSSEQKNDPNRLETLNLSNFSLSSLPGFLLPILGHTRDKVHVYLEGNLFPANQPYFEF